MVKISIIIVHYKVKDELLDCLNSIYKSSIDLPFEVIVVDNDEVKTIKTILKKKFSDVLYIPNNNKGFGQGNNVGANYATGEYLFFLNPDTEVYRYAIDKLVKFFQKNKNIGMVAPLLLGKDRKPYQQGAQELTPLRGIFALSFINKFIPNNAISRKYFLSEWDKKQIKEADVIPGTAFMIKKSTFKQIDGFDENFFLYFEEFDLCKRVKKLGLKNYINPEAKVIHYWGVSTRKRIDIMQIFVASRSYYFRKHFGFVAMILTEAMLRLNKYIVLMIIILIALIMYLNFFIKHV